ncbi:fumarylacetoacetate hydrolase family protein [Rhodococcus koreensis]
MRLTTIRFEGATTAARDDGDCRVPIPGYSDLSALLRVPEWREIAAAASANAVETHAYGVLLPEPSKVICTGLNYRGHIVEAGRAVPAHPTLFAKFAETLTGPYDPITIPNEDPQVDWEGELAFVVGKTAYKVPEADAAEYIAGYTVADDISMRGWQNRTIEWLQGKIWARSTPMGPVLVTPDEFDRDTATLVTTVNGEVVQQHATADLLFSPEHLLAYISTMLPLRPGDIVLTGTPGGIGHAREPRRYLQDGDRVEVAIDGIGTISNLTARAQQAASREPLQRF